MVSRHYYNPSPEQQAAVQRLRAQLQARRLRRIAAADWVARWEAEAARFNASIAIAHQANVATGRKHEPRAS